MHEARIILPKLDNEGVELDRVHKALAAELCRSFGGATVTDGRGMWVNPDGELFDEDVAVFVVAGENTVPNNMKLRIAAHTAGQRAGQEAIYYADFAGNVVITEPHDIPLAA